MSAPLLAVRDLHKIFSVKRGPFRRTGSVRAVEGVSFEIRAGETLALVGESGCGKTTLAKMILGLEKPTAGDIRFDGASVVNADAATMRNYRHQAQAVFQDPYSSLNPRLKVGMIIAEPLLAHEKTSPKAVRKRVEELLDVVGLPAAAADNYPHEFSGGQRQRIAIARSLVLNPRFLVLDEPISALDVSIRSQVLNLLADIQEEYSLTYLIIAHDLALVEHFSTHVGVMYLGSMVEYGPTDEVYDRPSSPYTKALLASVPRPDPDFEPVTGVIRGEIGSAMDPPPGCKFHPRCPYAMEVCRTATPTVAISDRHWMACHLSREAVIADRVRVPSA